jgi:hypothetical protein
VDENQRKVLMSVIETIGQLNTISDMDDACVRVSQRKIAEVLGLPLEQYPLLKEPLPRKPRFYLEYSPVSRS